MLASISLLGVVVEVGSKACAVCDTGLPVALQLCHPVRGRVCSLVVRVEAPRYISELGCEVPTSSEIRLGWGLRRENLSTKINPSVNHNLLQIICVFAY